MLQSSRFRRYSEHIKLAIQDVLDLRQHGWETKEERMRKADRSHRDARVAALAEQPGACGSYKQHVAWRQGFLESAQEMTRFGGDAYTSTEVSIARNLNG